MEAAAASVFWGGLSPNSANLRRLHIENSGVSAIEGTEETFLGLLNSLLGL
jgi:hypothetical protein